jgi:cytosine/adenosine deaminase-related metal-dependent hydrolase
MKDVIANSYWARNALLGDGWARNVLIHADKHGTIVCVEPNQQAGNNSERLKGTLLSGIRNLHSHAHQRAIAGLCPITEAKLGDGFFNKDVYVGGVKVIKDEIHPKEESIRSDFQAIVNRLVE